MATLYINEYGGLAGDLPEADVLAVNNVVIGASSVQSNPFGPNTSVARVHADSICSISFGANPTATNSNARMAANSTEYFTVRPGECVAVIANT